MALPEHRTVTRRLGRPDHWRHQFRSKPTMGRCGVSAVGAVRIGKPGRQHPASVHGSPVSHAAEGFGAVKCTAGKADRPSGKLGGLIHLEAGMTLWSLTLPIGTVLVLALMDWLYDNR